MHPSCSAEPDSFRPFFPFEGSTQVDRVLANTRQLADAVERSLRPLSLQSVNEILQKVNDLSPLEKLLLYLKLPTGNKQQEPLKQPVNPLGSRVEISQTITWIKTHLCVDKETSLPKQDIYQEYVQYCNLHKFKPLSTADFGKVMKQVYPDVRPRRLGTRGNSRYCYSGVATRDHLETPTLPSLLSDYNKKDKDDSDVVCSWASQVLGVDIRNTVHLGEYLVHNNLQPVKQQLSHHNGDLNNSGSKANKLSELSAVSNSSRSTSSLACKRKLEGGATSDTSPVSGVKASSAKKCNRRGKSSLDFQNSAPTTPTTPTLERGKMQKLPIPRLPKVTLGQEQLTAAPKRQKPLQPKPTPSEFLENGNSTEQEEELAKYFEGTAGGQKSQLRMLLERNNSGQKKVSFGDAQPSPNTRKKFSFVPISPTASVTPNGGGSLLERMLAQGRSQSVPPPAPPHPTPVEQLSDLQGSAILDPASLNHLFSLIGAELDKTTTAVEEEEERSTSATTTTCSSYCSSRGDPVVSAAVSPQLPPLPLLEDTSVTAGVPDLSLPLVDTFYDFAGEVTHIGSCEVPPPDL